MTVKNTTTLSTHSDNNSFLTAFWNDLLVAKPDFYQSFDEQLVISNVRELYNSALSNNDLENDNFNTFLSNAANVMELAVKQSLIDQRINISLGICGVNAALCVINPVFVVLGVTAFFASWSKLLTRYLQHHNAEYALYNANFKGYQTLIWLNEHRFSLSPRAVKNYEMQTHYSLLQHTKSNDIVKLGTTKIQGFNVNVYNVVCTDDDGALIHNICFSVNLKSNTFAKPTLSTFSLETINSSITLFQNESEYCLCSDLVLQSEQAQILDNHDYKIAVSDAISFCESDILYAVNALQDHQPGIPFHIQKTDTHLYYSFPLEMLTLMDIDTNLVDSNFNLINENQPIISTLIHLISKCSKAKSLGEI